MKKHELGSIMAALLFGKTPDPVLMAVELIGAVEDEVGRVAGLSAPCVDDPPTTDEPLSRDVMREKLIGPRGTSTFCTPTQPVPQETQPGPLSVPPGVPVVNLSAPATSIPQAIQPSPLSTPPCIPVINLSAPQAAPKATDDIWAKIDAVAQPAPAVTPTPAPITIPTPIKSVPTAVVPEVPAGTVCVAVRNKDKRPILVRAAESLATTHPESHKETCQKLDKEAVTGVVTETRAEDDSTPNVPAPVVPVASLPVAASRVPSIAEQPESIEAKRYLYNGVLVCDNNDCGGDSLEIVVPNLPGDVKAVYTCKKCGHSECFTMAALDVIEMKKSAKVLGHAIDLAPVPVVPPVDAPPIVAPAAPKTEPLAPPTAPKTTRKKSAAKLAVGKPDCVACSGTGLSSKGTPCICTGVKPAEPVAQAAAPVARPEIKSLVDGIVGYEPPPVDREAAKLELTVQFSNVTRDKLLKRFDDLTGTTAPAEMSDEILRANLVDLALNQMFLG